MKIIMSICCLLLLQAAQAQKDINGSFKINGVKREYIIHVPASYRPGTAVPLMLVFHGGGGNSKQMQRYFEMDAVADKEGWITVYPNAIKKNWNDGREVNAAIAANDDAQFVNQLLDTLEKQYSIDGKRVYATGISNGGFFSIYLALKLSQRFTAVAPVCASIPEKLYSSFNPARPVSIMFMNGTEDPLVPYAGGEVGSRFTGSRGRCTHTDSSVKKMVAVNVVNPSPAVEALPDTDPKDQCRATQYTYTGGWENTRVVLLKIEGGGHTAPGCSQYLPKFIIGRTCKDFQAAEKIVSFFKDCGVRN